MPPLKRIAITLTTLILLSLVIAAVLAANVVIERKAARDAIAERRKIDTAKGIETDDVVSIGGIPQYINIRGHNRANPVLLYLHGGPGTPMTPIAHAFQDAWEHHFTVVQWDQRAAGKTYRLNTPDEIAANMSFERMMDDVVDMTQHLRQRFGQEKIFLLGHSWGSIIGLPVAKKHPELYHAYIGTGQTIHPMQSETLGYARTLFLARKVGHAEAIRELEALAPYPVPVDALKKSGTRHKWNAYFGESVFGYRNLGDAILDLALNSPDYGWRDLWTLVQEDQSVYDAVQDDILSYDAYRYGRDWTIPVLFLEGRHDWQVNHGLVKEYFDTISAPFKAFFYLENAAHAPMVTRPERFAEILIEHARPLADRDSAPADLPTELFIEETM